jgi:hypothetical protein
VRSYDKIERHSSPTTELFIISTHTLVEFLAVNWVYAVTLLLLPRLPGSADNLGIFYIFAASTLQFLPSSYRSLRSQCFFAVNFMFNAGRLRKRNALCFSSWKKSSDSSKSKCHIKCANINFISARARPLPRHALYP